MYIDSTGEVFINTNKQKYTKQNRYFHCDVASFKLLKKYLEPDPFNDYALYTNIEYVKLT
jgi:hypothetical protein